MRFIFFIKNLLINNPVKTTIWSISLFILYFPVVRGISDDVYTGYVTQVVQLDSRYATIYQRKDRAEYLLLISDEKPVYKNNQFVISETSGLFVLCVILGGIGLLICIISTFATDHDDGWQIGKQWIQSRVECVECHLEENKYYYIYRGRLVSESEHQLNPYDLEKLMSTVNIKLFPKFETKKQSRHRKLDELQEV